MDGSVGLTAQADSAGGGRAQAPKDRRGKPAPGEEGSPRGRAVRAAAQSGEPAAGRPREAARPAGGVCGPGGPWPGCPAARCGGRAAQAAVGGL